VIKISVSRESHDFTCSGQRQFVHGTGDGYVVLY